MAAQAKIDKRGGGSGVIRAPVLEAYWKDACGIGGTSSYITVEVGVASAPWWYETSSGTPVKYVTTKYCGNIRPDPLLDNHHQIPPSACSMCQYRVTRHAVKYSSLPSLRSTAWFKPGDRVSKTPGKRVRITMQNWLGDWVKSKRKIVKVTRMQPGCNMQFSPVCRPDMGGFTVDWVMLTRSPGYKPEQKPADISWLYRYPDTGRYRPRRCFH
ncbi:hypothetical protein B0H13DRAFT_1852097 [Mycena leptocephala]|nr:hypothetical protein B0H13DRAFT_1852097 [Mycena leptocephala]